MTFEEWLKIERTEEEKQRLAAAFLQGPEAYGKEQARIIWDAATCQGSRHFKADQLDGASIQKIMDAHTDVTGAVGVEVQTNDAKNVLWVNVNGVCLLRACQIQELKIDGAYWRKGWRGESTN